MATNLADVVADSAVQRPTQIAVIDGDIKISYAALDDRISVTAAGLLGNVHRGDRVALLLGNTVDFIVAFYAVVRAGAIAVPLNTTLTPAEIEHSVNECGARLLVTDSVAGVNAAGAVLGSCVTMVVGGSDWLALQARGAKQPILTETDPESIAVLLFTAGSAGKPKAAMLTHRALLANLTALRSLEAPAAILPDDLTLAVLPLFHVYSLNAVLSLTLAAGATVVLCARFTPRGTLDLIARHNVTVVAGAPPMYVAWSAETGLREQLGHVRLLTSGAAPLPPALFDQFQTTTGQSIWEGYGLTECAPVVTTTLVRGVPKAGSVGAPLPNLEVRVIAGLGEPSPESLDAEDDAETGEIWVRGPSVFSGYWPDGAGGANEVGWFPTGDVGYFDHEGDLHLVDRRSDLILVSGFNVYPREVEHVIDALAEVGEVAVVGVPHPYSGAAVKAFVVPAEGQDIIADDVLAWCETRLARFKCPTIIEVVESLPHATTGKIAKAQLRQM